MKSPFWYFSPFLLPANEVCEGYVFTGVCPHQGACIVLFGGGVCVVLFGGHAWFYSGGMRGFIQGVCVVLFGGACMVLFGGHVWFYSGGVHGFIWRGMHGFIRRGHAWFYSGGVRGFIWGACMVLFGGCAWFYSGGHAWFFQFFWIQWDTVNERAVHILLECILVIYFFSKLKHFHLIKRIRSRWNGQK